jgi:hypothetical protein
MYKKPERDKLHKLEEMDPKAGKVVRSQDAMK